MTPRRVAIFAGVAVALLAAVAVGRWEGDRRATEEVRGMRTVLEAIGPLDQPSLDAFRFLETFQCLAYRRGPHPLALELCIDKEGRVIEAIDRRGDDLRIWSLREDHERSTLRVDRDEVDRLLLRMGVPQRLIDAAHER